MKNAPHSISYLIKIHEYLRFYVNCVREGAVLEEGWKVGIRDEEENAMLTPESFQAQGVRTCVISKTESADLKYFPQKFQELSVYFPDE